MNEKGKLRLKKFYLHPITTIMILTQYYFKIDAIINIRSIIMQKIGIPKKSPCIFKYGIKTIIGTNKILRTVNLFGKFIFFFLSKKGLISP